MSFLDSYEPVEDRLREFWSDHPSGRIVTQLVHHGSAPGEVLVFLAECYRDADPRPAASGWAHQRLLEAPPQGRNGPNTSAPEWTSPWEVAETSAIGRALANLGYAPKGKRPSREEVSKAENVPDDKYQGTTTKSVSPAPVRGSGTNAPSGKPAASDGGVATNPSVASGASTSKALVAGDTSSSGGDRTTSPVVAAPPESSSGEPSADTGSTPQGVGGPRTQSINGEQAPAVSQRSPENVQEPGISSGEGASPAPVDPSAKLTTDRVKALSAALGGQTYALGLARDEWPGTTTLRNLTNAQAAHLLEIAGVKI